MTHGARSVALSLALAAGALLTGALAVPAADAAPWGNGSGKARPAGGKKPAAAAQLAAQRDKLVAEGDRWMAEARREAAAMANPATGDWQPTPSTDRYGRQALEFYDAAITLAPDADTHYRAFTATQYLLDASLDKWRLVIRYFDGLRQASPRDPRETFMLPELCTALSKLGGAGGPDADAYYARGILEYDLFHQRLDDTDPRYARALSVYSTNAAELLMALGPDRLDEAIVYYEEGVQHGKYAPSESLGYYGLAVAYDRDGQWGKAVEMMREALARDPQTGDRRGAHAMGRLTDRGVYFVPEGDVEFYYGLGYQVQGHAQEALRHYKRFLAEVPDSRFAARAREHIAELEAELGGAARAVTK